MAKRDKLYTVNKWNKPFFEEERKKKLYAGGGDQNSIIPGLGSLDVYGWGNAGGIAPITPVIKPLYTQQENSNFDNYRGGYNPANRFTLYDVGVGTGGANQTSVPANFADTDKKQEKDWLSKASDALRKTYDVAMGYKTVKSATDGLKDYTPIDFRRLTQHTTPKTTEALKLANVGTNTLNSTNTIAGRSIPSIVDTSFNNAATKSAIKAKSAELAKQIGTHTATTPKIPSAGAQIGANLAGQFIGDAALNLIAPKMGEYTKVDDILGYARQATPLLNFIPGAQWWLPAVANAGLGLLSGLAKPLFGGYVEGKNEVLSDIARLNNINLNGSNEYLATLMANQPGVRHAKGHNSVFNKSPERDATKLNDAADYAESRFYRGIDNAIDNNNTIQLWHALNDYYTGAMGGKLNRKKCNCKSYGGYLDSATPTGFNFLSDLTNILMLKNQTDLNMNSSVGNSFMSTPDMGITFAKGGIMIKPENRGKFTAKAKRHGMGVQQFASYVLAHKDKFPSSTVKQAVFAKNSNNWKKAFGGKLNYGEDKDIRNNSFFNGPSLYGLGGVLQAGGSNWGRATEINEGGTHEESPYDGVLVGVDPEGTPNLVEEGEVIWNDYVFSNRIKVPKEVCKRLRIGQKKDGFTFADAAKKLLVESKERPNDPISKKGLEANMQLLEDAQEEVKKKMEAEQAVEQFNSLPPELQVAIMNQEGERALDAVAQEQMAQEFQNLPPEQQQAIAQQMAMEQAQPQGQPSPEEQAMMQQQMALQQMSQNNINSQEALALAAAMQQQALGGMALGGKLCFGGRKFAEGGELNGEQLTEQTDNEMAKYSDEELQDMIDDYQEAESGEVKVTKGKLARLRKKAEKAQAELERRHAEENTEQPQEARQEPSQEELQAAAQALAQQLMMEGQPQEGVPQEGMSPEQAMMMQQQMGGQPQMSPEEMAAAELQQLTGQLYSYGGRLYLTGGQLMGMFGLNTDSEIAKAGWKPEMFGISSWYDEIPQSTVDEWVAKGSFPWLNSDKQSEKWIPNNNIRRAIERGYNPLIPQKAPDQYDWHKPPKGALSPFFTSGSWAKYYGEEPTKDTIIDNDKYKAFIEAYPNALSGLNYTDNMTLGQIDDYMKKSPYWNLRQKWLWEHPNAKNNRLAYMANIAENNADAISKNNAKKFSALGIYDFKKTNNGYTVQRKDGVTDDQEKQWWDAVTSDYKYGDMYNTPDGPLSRDIYIDQDTGDVMYTKPNSDWTQVGNPYQSFIAGTTVNDPGYNQNIYFFKKNGTTVNNTNTDNTTDESDYLTVGWKPKMDWTGLALGVAPGLTGLAMLLGRGAPDMSELDKAVAAYERNTGTMIAPHLTHGLIRPAIVDPRVTENNLNARRLGTNRLLMNTGSTPSRGATILANDANTIGQLGQAMINNWRENRQQEQAAAAFNRETATTNANILNQVDLFNAQTQSALARDAAQLRYNAAKDKIAARDAYYAGLMGNLGSIFKGGYEAWRENQHKNERDLLAASGVFGETNGLIDNWLGISKVDPKTGKVIRGYNTGMYYWINPNTGKAEYLKTPPLATNTINAHGGKIKKNKKRKGYTF